MYLPSSNWFLNFILLSWKVCGDMSKIDTSCGGACLCGKDLFCVPPRNQCIQLGLF